MENIKRNFTLYLSMIVISVVLYSLIFSVNDCDDSTTLVSYCILFLLLNAIFSNLILVLYEGENKKKMNDLVLK